MSNRDIGLRLTRLREARGLTWTWNLSVESLECSRSVSIGWPVARDASILRRPRATLPEVSTVAPFGGCQSGRIPAVGPWNVFWGSEHRGGRVGARSEVLDEVRSHRKAPLSVGMGGTSLPRPCVDRSCSTDRRPSGSRRSEGW